MCSASVAEAAEGAEAAGLGARAVAVPDLSQASLERGISAYVHIPFCRVRCGYCDFNTYTKLDFPSGASIGQYPATLAREVALSARALGSTTPFATVFVGGGTPTMLPAAELGRILEVLRQEIGIVDGAEITTEANPETVTERSVAELAEAGFTRISFGMQSASEKVLATLERRHTDGQVSKAVGWARAEGLEVSVDLIYGTPGETAEDWDASLHAAVELGVDHVSAYALTIEPGTRMGQQVRRGLLPMPDPDVQADRYERAEEVLGAAGLRWYEISNWARVGHECRHNTVYWRNGNWWGYGPGAHSHIDGTRFWNLKHPLAYAQAVGGGRLPVDGFETLTPAERAEEEIMLQIRLAEGFEASADVLAGLENDGLVELVPGGHEEEAGWRPDGASLGRARLTLRGRLLADEVTRRLWDCLPD